MNTFSKYAFAALMGLAATMAAAIGLPAAASAETVAITGGRVVTGTEAGTLDGATVVIEDGRIAAVGANVAKPQGARSIDATGKWVTVGLMNPATMIGVDEVSLESSTTDHSINTGSPFAGEQAEVPFSAAFDVAYGINPNSTVIPIGRIEGLTRAAVLPGMGKSIFAGQGAVINLGDGYDIVTRRGAALVVGLGSSGADVSGGARGGAMFFLEQALSEAQAYGRRGGRAMPARERDSLLSRIDAEVLARVVAGDMPMLVMASRASDLLYLIRLRERFSGLRIAVLGAAEAWMVADQLAAAKIPVIIDPTANLPGSFDSLGSTLTNAAKLEKAGVAVAFSAGGFDSGHQARLVAQVAGIAVAHGMSWDAAFRAITLEPARIYGIDDVYGTLTAGKDADVVVWNGDPLELMSSPDAVFIRGKEITLQSRQTRLRDRYLDLAGDMPHAYRK